MKEHAIFNAGHERQGVEPVQREEFYHYVALAKQRIDKDKETKVEEMKAESAIKQFIEKYHTEFPVIPPEKEITKTCLSADDYKTDDIKFIETTQQVALSKLQETLEIKGQDSSPLLTKYNEYETKRQQLSTVFSPAHLKKGVSDQYTKQYAARLNYTAQDREIILYQLKEQIKNASNFKELQQIYEEHVNAPYVALRRHLTFLSGYTATKTAFIIALRDRTVELITEDKVGRKEEPMSTAGLMISLPEMAQMAQHGIFDLRHDRHGVSPASRQALAQARIRVQDDNFPKKYSSASSP